MKKTASVLVLAGSLAFAGVGAAHAVDAPYPAPAVPGGVTDGTVAPGQTFTFTGSGFLPGSTVTITITFSSGPQAAGAAGAGRVGAGVGGPIILSQALPVQTAVVGADGTFGSPVTLTEEGTYTVTATGIDPEGNPRTVASSVTVDADAAAGDAAPGSGTGTGAGTGAGAGDSADDGGLADTGADSAMLLWGAAGVLALGAGVASVVVARRKNA